MRQVCMKRCYVLLAMCCKMPLRAPTSSSYTPDLVTTVATARMDGSDVALLRACVVRSTVMKLGTHSMSAELSGQLTKLQARAEALYSEGVKHQSHTSEDVLDSFHLKAISCIESIAKRMKVAKALLRAV